MWAARSRSAPLTPRRSSPPAACALPPSRERRRGGSENNSAFANDATSPPGLTRGSILFAEGFLQRRWIAGHKRVHSRLPTRYAPPRHAGNDAQRRVKDRGLLLAR